MSEDIEYIKNYKPDTLYVNPGTKGAYATMAGESEVVIGEIDVTSRFKLAVSAFYVTDKQDFGTFKLTKLKYHAKHGWQDDGNLQINYFQLAQMKEFMEIIANLDLQDAKKTKLSLANVQVGAIGTILNSDKGAELLAEIANNPSLQEDIYAVAKKREALNSFENMLSQPISEPDWQSYFEENSWIFGHGLNYIFLEKSQKKLETNTTGSAFDKAGKRVDALMKTRAEISQYVLVEIKKPDTLLLNVKEYRSGCWNASEELSGAITQIQKTVFEFTRGKSKVEQRDDQGNSLGQWVYSIKPKSYLVIGSLSQLMGNDDKIACFELIRSNLNAPEIITFDELYERAKCIVENISAETNSYPNTHDEDEIPF